MLCSVTCGGRWRIIQLWCISFTVLSSSTFTKHPYIVSWDNSRLLTINARQKPSTNSRLQLYKQVQTTNVLWIKYWSARSELMTSHHHIHETISWPPSKKYAIMSEMLTPSIDAFALKEKSCQMSSRSDLKQWSFRLFWKRLPQQDEAHAKEQDE